MRSEEEIKDLIVATATTDDRVRAVLLNGSRADPNVERDQFQDFDVVFVVNNLESFISDHKWIEVFGEKIILQMPDQMTIGERAPVGFTYLMLFRDGNRIDLTLFPAENIGTNFPVDSLTVVWIDKDKSFLNIPEPTDSQYHIRRPTEMEFLDTCNEFWWVSTYVAKGLARGQIIYAREILETTVRPMLMKLVGWKIGRENNFSVSIGKAGKFIQRYLSEPDYKKLLTTYSDAEIENTWQSLFSMTELFTQFAKEVSVGLGFHYRTKEQEDTLGYLKGIYDDQL